MVLLETALTENFVCPNLCEALVVAGLTEKVLYQWRVKMDYIELCTKEFDPDNYYADSAPLLNIVTPPLRRLPAYSIKDVEKVLPADYCIEFRNGEYQASLGKIFETEHAHADRLPDAIAKLLLNALQKRIVDLKKVNAILSK